MVDVPPVPKALTVEDFDKVLRAISLTSTLSKLAESYFIERNLKPTLLRSLDPSQFGFIPGLSTTIALIGASLSEPNSLVAHRAQAQCIMVRTYPELFLQ
jgi:hypothetical protein